MGACLCLSLLALTACDQKSPTAGVTPVAGDKVRVERVEFGRLVDVYGYDGDGGAELTLFQKDVVVGNDIADERPPGSSLGDGEVTYDFYATDPVTLQPRLLIPRRIGSPAFTAAFDRLGARLRTVTPMAHGQGGPGLPYSVVPRNAAIRVVLSAPLLVDDEFFVARDEQGKVNGLRNTEAVQLLRIVGDPAQDDAFVPMPVRVLVKDRALVLDPVLLGDEGVQYQTVNNAEGMPASQDQLAANIRIAIALDGPLALPMLREESTSLIGKNNAGLPAIVRDFRSGNSADTSFDLAGGFVRDPLPLRVLGELPMFVERVDPVSSSVFEVTVFKGGLSHEIDRGDVFRFLSPGSGEEIALGEVVVDPIDDRDVPGVQHVRVRVRIGKALDAVDPSDLAGFPQPLAEREAWLRTNAPIAVLIAEFTAGGGEGRDDPRNFLRFSPEPLTLGGYTPRADEFVSPFAGAVVRFTKPVDLSTVRWADTFFFAMRDLASEAERQEFLQGLPNADGGVGIDPGAFDDAKYRTPFLVTARVFDEDGSQTSLRLQPTSGFYLDDTMRNPPAGVTYPYYLHLISDSPVGGIRDLAGNRLDLQGTTAERANAVVIPFTLDTRSNGAEPLFPDNLAVSIVRRFASRDEDARPSWFLPEEVRGPGGPQRAAAVPLDDVFGACVYLDGRLLPRPTTRTRVVADNQNQSPVVQQPETGPQDPLGWCPQTVAGQFQRASNTATNVLNQGIQNPLNPYGCRLQTVWREVDLSLSRTDPFDFNLDIEQMYWAPYTGTNILFDEFDATSLFLTHSEYRPAPCVGNTSALASMPNSGLRFQFEGNRLANKQPTGNGALVESLAPRTAAYVDQPLAIEPSWVVREPTGVNRYLPLPTFQKPYFVFRDETVMEQGGDAGRGSDLSNGANGFDYAPYVVSPFANGLGGKWVDVTGPSPSIAFVNAFWNDAPNHRIDQPSTQEGQTDGLCGAIAMPLLADFRTMVDSSELPIEDPFTAFGTNGWQVAITVQSGAQPNFRVLSAGRPSAAPQGGLPLTTSSPFWSLANGGWGPGATPSASWVATPAGDNTFYWMMMDVVKRQSVITAGFVDLHNPHRVPEGFGDPRLGPFYLQGGSSTLPANVLPDFAYEFDPPLSKLPAGTSIVPQFRGASAVDPQPWYWNSWANTTNPLFPAASPQSPLFTAAMRAALRPNSTNFPLDPFKAGDAHIRKWDTRAGRNWWTHLYNRTVTRYVEHPNELMQPSFCNQYSGPTDPFRPRDVRYVNWRFVTGNNVDVDPPVAPMIETFALSYRFTPR
ncbi:MAG: hypothetical protein JNK15_21995 [Planctomycetes bacterium]|nr:hypothetical protein [Planctomycetota bacterium]